MRVIAPIMKALSDSRSALPAIRSAPDIVDVKSSAEKKDIADVQEKAKKLVWASGCTSWAVEPSTGRNSMMFPDWQYRFWLRSVFIAWSDLSYRTSKDMTATRRQKQPWAGAFMVGAMSALIGAGAVFYRGSFQQ